MSTAVGSPISAVEAARRIYNTPQPTTEQVGRTVEKIEAGTLPRGPRGGMTTTAEAFAEYMARREAARTGAHLRTPGAAGEPVPVKHAAKFNPFYRGVLKDYFLAVVLRRDMAHRSPVFQRLVLAGQAVLLVAIISLMITGAATAMRVRALPPEQQAVQTWLAGKYEGCEVTSLRTQPDSRVLARFRYQVNGRVIQSELLLRVQAGQVLSIDSD
ncbi:MAG: hypothetical protein SFU86_17870 [Pirellulaceae bacterium]|nr:hypothetical protein [Pirellulaceae bacterium]